MAKMLYMVMCYNPQDNNPEYFKPGGYIYGCLDSAYEAKSKSRHEIDIAVVGFSLGSRSKQCLKDYRTKKGRDFLIYSGPDASSYIGANRCMLATNSNYQYDYVLYCVSDAIFKNPYDLDQAVQDFEKDQGCDFLYIRAEPGLPLPGSTIHQSYYSCIPMDRGCHHNVHMVKSKYLKSFDNRLFMDVFESSTIEAFMGYLCYSQGGYRKISKFLDFDHVGGRGKSTDRKRSHLNENKVRGNSHASQSPLLKRDLGEIIKRAARVGIHFVPSQSDRMPVISSGITKGNMLSRKQQKRMYQYMKSGFFLQPNEVDYSKVAMEIL